jgi:hypothetical protein
MVTPPASTGKQVMIMNAVINQAQQNSGSFMSVIPGARILRMVTMILMDPRMEDKPNKWTEKISRSPPISTLPELPTMDKGG